MRNGNGRNKAIGLCLQLLFCAWIALGATFTGSQAQQPTDGQQSNPENYRIRSMMAHGKYVFAGLYGYGEIYRSEDQGQSWKLMQSGVGKIVYKFGKAGETLFAGTLGGLYRSTDNGQTWDLVSNNGMSGLRGNAAAIGHNGKVFAGTDKGIYRSTDAGVTWTAAKNGLGDVAVHSLASMGKTVLAGTASGLFTSTDGGGSWQRAGDTGLPLGDVWDMVSIGKTLYACGTRAFMSSNEGQTWTELKYNSSSLLNTRSLAVVGETLFVGTRFKGIYRLTDSGLELADSGIPPRVQIFAMAGSGSVLLAGVYEEGIYRSSDLGQSWTMSNRGISNSK